MHGAASARTTPAVSETERRHAPPPPAAASPPHARYRVLDGAKQMVYSVRPDVCCLGACVLCKCGGKGAKCCRVPFYIREPATREKIDGGAAAFVDMWAGWKAECCTHKDLYALKASQSSSLRRIERRRTATVRDARAATYDEGRGSPIDLRRIERRRTTNGSCL